MLRDVVGVESSIACPRVISHLQRERGRIAEEIARLQSSQDALDTMLVAARGRRAAALAVAG